MRVLLTGAAGFIGSAVAEAFDGTTARMTGVDPVHDPGCDVRRFAAEDDTRYDVAIHCAAAVVSTAEKATAGARVAENVEIDAAFFRWAARTRPGRVVYFSSSCAYPEALTGEDGKPLREEDITLRAPEWPDGLYGWAKLTGELLAGELGVPVTVMRPFSVYGPGMKPGFAVSSFTAQLAASPAVEIWGTGTQVRDYIHVSDVARAVVAAVAEGVDGPVNLGTGTGTSLPELARMIRPDATIRLEPGKMQGPERLVADVLRLSMFCPPRIGLEEGLAGL